MAVLSDEEVDAALPELAGWERVDNALRRSVKFPSFLAGIDAVRRIAEAAEAADHHPDIDIRWRTVTFVLSTHSEGGITQKELALAKQIDEIVGQKRQSTPATQPQRRCTPGRPTPNTTADRSARSSAARNSAATADQ